MDINKPWFLYLQLYTTCPFKNYNCNYNCKYVIFSILVFYFYLDLQLFFYIKNVLNNLKIKR